MTRVITKLGSLNGIVPLTIKRYFPVDSLAEKPYNKQ
jgi:hypothetical protein